MAKNNVEFWLVNSAGTYFQLPVNPEEISYSNPYGINTLNIASLGEVSIPGERGLKQISFGSFFPRDYNSSYCEYEGFMSPREWFSHIQTWRYTREPIRLIITGTNINLPMYISEFDVVPERAGEPGDMYYTLTLIEHRPFSAKSIKKVETAKATAPVVKSTERPAPKKSEIKTHTVAKGDTLYKISKSFYGDGSKWRTIYDANKSVIGKNPNLIRPGQKLVIP